jgi:hypothetical protein
MASNTYRAWLRVLLVGASVGALVPGAARAHFTLLEPESWIEEGSFGDPQKDSPCGDDGTGTRTNALTTYQAGETVTLRWRETIFHPGHWRIAIARDRSELQDPAVASMVDNRCNYPAGAADVPEAYPVLMDNLFPRTSDNMGSEFSQEITIPDMSCERCTLQVIQFMTNHSRPCIYYHCADIAIVGGSGSAVDAGAPEPTADAGSSVAGASASGAGGTPVAGANGSGASGSAAAGTAGTSSVPAGNTGMTSGGTNMGGMMPGGGATTPTGGATDNTAGAGDDGGCAVGGALGGTQLAWIVLALLWQVRRARRRPLY